MPLVRHDHRGGPLHDGGWADSLPGVRRFTQAGHPSDRDHLQGERLLQDRLAPAQGGIYLQLAGRSSVDHERTEHFERREWREWREWREHHERRKRGKPYGCDIIRGCRRGRIAKEDLDALRRERVLG
jgi:hypothetical protein